MKRRLQVSIKDQDTGDEVALVNLEEFEVFDGGQRAHVVASWVFDKSGDIGVRQTRVLHFRRKRYNVFGLVFAALQSLNERDFLNDKEAGAPDLARGLGSPE